MPLSGPGVIISLYIVDLRQRGRTSLVERESVLAFQFRRIDSIYSWSANVLHYDGSDLQQCMFFKVHYGAVAKKASMGLISS